MTNDTFTDAAPTLTMRQRLDAIAEAAIPPEYFVAQRIASEAKELLKHLAPPAAELPHPLDSGEIRDEWIDETAELETRRQQMERRRGVLLTLLRDARMRAQHLRASQTQNVLAALNDELKRCLRKWSKSRTSWETLKPLKTPSRTMLAHSGNDSPNWPTTTPNSARRNSA